MRGCNIQQGGTPPTPVLWGLIPTYEQYHDTQHSKLDKPTNMGQKGIIDHVKQVELRLG